MAYTSRALSNRRILCITFIVCNLYAVVSSSANDTEQGPWCNLKESPEAVGSMECKFNEEVQFIQVDYYPFDSQGPPVIAVSCDQAKCEPNTKFVEMLKVRGSPSKQLLTLTLHGVPKEHAGKYRCQAQSTANSQTEEGVCSLRFPNTGENAETTGASDDDVPLDPPTEEFNPLILLVLLVVPIVAIAIGIVICKLKNCGPCKQSEEDKQSPRDEENPEQERPLLVKDEKEKLQKPFEEDQNEQEGKEEAMEGKEEAVEQGEEGKTTNENENAENKKEEKNSDDGDDEKAEEGNDSSSEQKDGDITEEAPGDISNDVHVEKATTIATDEEGKGLSVRYVPQ